MRWNLGPMSLAVLAGAIFSCVEHRNATIRPALVIHVVDSTGAPVAGAHVMIMHETNPHSRLDDWWPLDTGADGTVTTSQLFREETVAPFCMHGVAVHYHFVCAGLDGRGVDLVKVEGHEVTLRLHEDYKDDCWNAQLYRFVTTNGVPLTSPLLARSREQV